MNRYGAKHGVRIVHDPVRDKAAVLYPEGVLLINETAADVLRLADGSRTSEQIAENLALIYEGVTAESVRELLEDLVVRRILVTGDAGGLSKVELMPGSANTDEPVPVGLLAELTYRCPLSCAYCSNPVELSRYSGELDTGAWHRVITEARHLGVLQIHLSGGEPLLRKDLASIVAHARSLGMYTNLITSGIPSTHTAVASLKDAGLDHLQLSIQDSEPDAARAVAGIDALSRKLKAAEWVRDAGLPLTANVVLHTANIGRLLPIAELAVRMGAQRLELAHTQYYGWAWRNRNALMPSRVQIEEAAAAVTVLRQEFGSAVEVVYVEPDYYTGTAKPCMNGWASRQLTVAPNGDVLPCLAAAGLPGPAVPSVRRETLRDIWYDAAVFNQFRGTTWLPEPCQSCALRDVDFGGCRCQAFQLTGDAAATDPACRLSPHHGVIESLLAEPAGAVTPRRWR